MIFGGEALVLTSFLRGETAVRVAVNALAGTDDLRAVGPLAEALAMGEPSYSLAVSALTRLLPRLGPSDAHLLTETQRACLRRALKQSSSRLVFWRTNPRFGGVLSRALAALEEVPSTGFTANEQLYSPLPSNVEAQLEQFQAAVRRRQKNAVGIGVSAVVGAGSALANIIVPMITYHPAGMPLLGLAVASIGTTVYLSFHGLFSLKNMMNDLADAGDLRVVGPLLEIAAIQDGNANTMAALLLTRLLPRLRASDATLLTDAQRAAFGRALVSNVNNPDFLIAALKALEQVGEGGVLPVVESLATGKLRTANPEEVQTAARECLPFLQARFEQQRASQSLLRASERAETPPEQLLRAAHGVPNTENQELLRPGTPRLEVESEEMKHNFTLSLIACHPGASPVGS